MTGAVRRGELRRLVPEILLMGLVLAGFINCVHRFIVDGKLPQPFIFDINDTFMDWFNTAFYAHNPGAFDRWHTVYPPLSFVFLKFFGEPRCYLYDSVTARDCDTIGIIAIVSWYVLGVIFSCLAFAKMNRMTSPMRGLSFAIGLPLLFTLERGNLIIPCFAFFVLGHGRFVRSRLTRAIALGFTINFKPYLLLPVLAQMFKRQWRFFELAGVASISIYIITFAVLGSGSPVQLISNTLNWVQFTGGLVWEQIYYTTSYAPFLEFNTSRFPTRDFVPSQIIDPLVFAIPIVIRASQLLALLCLVGAWLQPRALTSTRVSILLLAASLIGQSPGGYTEVFLVFLVFLEPWDRPGPIIALVMGYLLCIPYDYVVANFITLSGNSWLGGRTVVAPFGVSIGIFLRPGFIVIMFWSLALDSLILIARAHRLHRPTTGLAWPRTASVRPVPS